MTDIRVRGTGPQYRMSGCTVCLEKEFILEVGEKHYRFGIDRNGDLNLMLVNGVDCKVISMSGYPAIKLINR